MKYDVVESCGITLVHLFTLPTPGSNRQGVVRFPRTTSFSVAIFSPSKVDRLIPRREKFLSFVRSILLNGSHVVSNEVRTNAMKGKLDRNFFVSLNIAFHRNVIRIY